MCVFIGNVQLAILPWLPLLILKLILKALISVLILHEPRSTVSRTTKCRLSRVQQTLDLTDVAWIPVAVACFPLAVAWKRTWAQVEAFSTSEKVSGQRLPVKIRPQSQSCGVFLGKPGASLEKLVGWFASTQQKVPSLSGSARSQKRRSQREQVPVCPFFIWDLQKVPVKPIQKLAVFVLVRRTCAFVDEELLSRAAHTNAELYRIPRSRRNNWEEFKNTRVH